MQSETNPDIQIVDQILLRKLEPVLFVDFEEKYQFFFFIPPNTKLQWYCLDSLVAKWPFQSCKKQNVYLCFLHQ